MDDFDFSTLPEDPEAAFVMVAQILRLRSEQQIRNAGFFTGKTQFMVEYIRNIRITAQTLEVHKFAEIDVPAANDTEIAKSYRNLLMLVEGEILRISISKKGSIKTYSVGLNDIDKIKIRHFTEQIKETIDAASISVPKKDVLYKKINAFVMEVDKIRTSLEAFSDLAIGLAQVGGEAVAELEPARRWLDSISRLLGHYRDIEEAQRALPAPPRQLEPPRGGA